MKTIRQAIQVMVCGLCAATALPAVSAETRPDFYVGLGVGESSFDFEKAEFDDVVVDAFLSQGSPIGLGTSTFEDSDTTLSLFAGYHFNPYIAIEAGYVDLGAAKYRRSGTVNPTGPIVSTPVSVDIDVESKGFTLAGLGSLPLGNVVDLHGRLGFLFAATDLSVIVRSGSVSGDETATFDSFGGYFGVGAGFNLGEHWSLSLDWSRYANVGDEDEDDDARTQAGFDIDALSFSAMLRF